MKFLHSIVFLLLVVSHSQLGAQDIFEAARKGNLARIEALIKLKPDTLNSRNENGFTPLIIAVYRNQTETAEYLLKNGSYVNAQSPEGPAIVAAAYKRNIQMVELLIRSKANLDAGNEDGTTALMYAAMGNDEALVNLLVKKGAGREIAAKNGRRAIDLAKMNGFENIVELLSE